MSRFNKACVTWKTRLGWEDKIHVLRDVRHPVWSQHLRCVNNVAGSDKESAPKQDKSLPWVNNSSAGVLEGRDQARFFSPESQPGCTLSFECSESGKTFGPSGAGG